jgi:hypothetical protein
MKRVTQTRWKLTLIAMGLFLAEAIVKTLVSGFPLTELFAAQGGAIGFYLGAKTVNNIKEKHYEQND